MRVETIRTADRKFTVKVTEETETHLSYIPVRLNAEGQTELVPVFMPGRVAKDTMLERQDT